MKRIATSFQILILILLPMILFSQDAQTTSNPVVFKPSWTLQLNGGATQYFGDLNKDDWFNQSPKVGFGGILGYQFSPLLGTRLQFVGGKLYSEHESKGQKLNSSFMDAALHLTLNINEIFADYNPKRAINFYLFTGAGLSSFLSTTSVFSTDVEIQKHDSRQNELFVPIGLGAGIRLTDAVNLNIEYGDHLLFSDNTLDFFESQKARDHYSYASAGISFRFGKPKDTDDDGIRDKEDNCPDRPGKVELFGCPDADNDGIADDQDACPKDAGKLEFKGCPDTDNDGIPDKDDNCPDAAGTREMKGCPDKDKDGITDKEDQCPDMAGKKELAGCPDKDGDGIPDKDDACPEIAGLRTLAGCPDRDNDGVADSEDKCPDVAGSKSSQGCPETTGVLVNETVYFNTDQYIVIAEYNQLLHKIAETLRDNPGIRIRVEGHTDSRESKAYNMKLSENRADYIIKFFTERNIDPARIQKDFFGESKPAADNSTDEGLRLNRRVEIRSIL